MSDRTKHKVHKSFTFTQLSDEDFEVLEQEAKDEHRTLTGLLTIYMKKIVKSVREKQAQRQNSNTSEFPI